MTKNNDPWPFAAGWALVAMLSVGLLSLLVAWHVGRWVLAAALSWMGLA